MRYAALLPLYVEPLWNDEPQRHEPTVSEHRPVETGLFDHRGVPIMRLPDRMGFHRPGK